MFNIKGFLLLKFLSGGTVFPNPSLRSPKKSRLKWVGWKDQVPHSSAGHHRRFVTILSIYEDVQRVYVRLKFAVHSEEKCEMINA